MEHNHAHNAYKTTDGMVRKTRQVVMLYDGMIRFMQQAKEAIEKNDIQQRYNSLQSACDIVNGLQLSLDMDQGGEVARLLYDFYAGLDMRLLSVHQSNDIKMMEACIGHVKTMREAWVEIDEAEANKEVQNDDDSALYDEKIAQRLSAPQAMSESDLSALQSISVSV